MNVPKDIATIRKSRSTVARLGVRAEVLIVEDFTYNSFVSNTLQPNVHTLGMQTQWMEYFTKKGI